MERIVRILEKLSILARGMSTRGIVGHLRDLNGIEVSADLVSTVTDGVLDEIAAWQVRPAWSRSIRLIFFALLGPQQGRHPARERRQV